MIYGDCFELSYSRIRRVRVHTAVWSSTRKTFSKQVASKPRRTGRTKPLVSRLLPYCCMLPLSMLPAIPSVFTPSTILPGVSAMIRMIDSSVGTSQPCTHSTSSSSTLILLLSCRLRNLLLSWCRGGDTSPCFTHNYVNYPSFFLLRNIGPSRASGCFRFFPGEKDLKLSLQNYRLSSGRSCMFFFLNRKTLYLVRSKTAGWQCCAAVRYWTYTSTTSEYA